jgi:hypothetical protein
MTPPRVERVLGGRTLVNRRERVGFGRRYVERDDYARCRHLATAGEQTRCCPPYWRRG